VSRLPICAPYLVFKAQQYGLKTALDNRKRGGFWPKFRLRTGSYFFSEFLCSR
jgi:hypothetical protein